MSDFRNIRIVVHDLHGLPLCDVIHAESASPLVYGSGAYIRFLLRVLPKARFYLLIAMDNDLQVGYLPLFGQLGLGGLSVMNSSPFFGSHGGPIVRQSYAEPGDVVNALLAGSMQFARDQNTASITLIEHPLAPLDGHVLARHGFSAVDDRIGQFTYLPVATNMVDAQSALMDIFHVKTRNAIRKGLRLGQVFKRRTDMAAVAWLQEVHEQSIMGLGGVPKSKEIFAHLLEQLVWERGARLYIGSINGTPVSGLLLLLHGNTVEYFTPVAVDAYKEQQVLSALILHAMAEAVVEGRKVWNWGGTWRTQEGVYRFKNRFGAVDRPYRYFTKLLNPALHELPGNLARQEFPYFYTYRYTS
jgi:hypothetical protein